MLIRWCILKFGYVRVAMVGLDALQLVWWNFAFKKLANHDDQSVPSYQKIAAEEAVSFLKSDHAKPFLAT